MLADFDSPEAFCSEFRHPRGYAGESQKSMAAHANDFSRLNLLLYADGSKIEPTEERRTRAS
jgi:hypothetical protein